MTNLSIDVDVERFIISEPDPNDSWDYGQSGMNVTVLGASIVEDDRGYKVLNTKDHFAPGDIGYVLWVHYDTGSTFGSEQVYQIVAVLKDKDFAYKYKSYIEKDYKTVYQSFDFRREFEGYHFYADWKGYFEHLNSVNVTEVMIEDNNEV